MKFNMGCCFSKELNPNPLSERTSLLLTSVTESCVKKYSSVTELFDEKRPEYGRTNRGVDVRSDASSTSPSASLTGIHKRSSSVQDGTMVWAKSTDVSRNKPLGDDSKDSGIQAQTEAAVLNSVKQRIAENAVKRANWFCEVDSTRFKSGCEETTAAHTLVPSDHVRSTCASDDVSSELSLTQKQEQEQAKTSTNQKSHDFLTAKYPYDDHLDSDEKRSEFLTSECIVKRRTQSFYSICSIDTDDLGGERDSAAGTLPAAFSQTDLLTNPETEVVINTTLTNTALETLNQPKEAQKHDEMVCEDLPVETLSLSMAHVLPDLMGMFYQLSVDKDSASGACVCVSPEDGVKEKSENHGHKSHVTDFHKTGEQTIPDLLERNWRLAESVLDHAAVDSACPTDVNTHAKLRSVSKPEVTEMSCGVQCSETPEQEPRSVSSESRNSDNKENQLNFGVDCREPKQVESSKEVNLGVMSINLCHEPVPCSHTEPHPKAVEDFLVSEISKVNQIIKNQPSSFLISSLESESEAKSPKFISESSSQDLNLNCKSCSSPGKDIVSEPGVSVCTYAEREFVDAEPESGFELNSHQSLNSFTSLTSGGDGDALQPEMLWTGLLNYPGFDVEKTEMSIEDVNRYLSSAELSDLAPDSEIAQEHVETSENPVKINSNAEYEDLLKVNQSLVKAFSENSTSLTRMEQEISTSPVFTSSDADCSVPTNLLEDASQNPEDHTISEEHMLPPAAQESFGMKEGDGCCLKENETWIKAECFNEHAVEEPNLISLNVHHVKASKMDLQSSKSMDFDLSLGRNKDKEVMPLYLEGSSENAALSVHSSPHTEPPDTFKNAVLTKNSMQCECAHYPTHTLLGKTDTQSFPDPSSQEPELTHGDVEGVQMMSTAEQQVGINFRVPFGRTIRPMFEIREAPHALGHDSSDEGIECFVASRLQGYQLADGLHVSGPSCGLITAGICPVSHFCADNKAIPLPVEPDQVDLYASTPSYEIHFLGSNSATGSVQAKNPQNLTSINEEDRERGVLTMLSDLLGKSELNEDEDCSRFLSVWVAEPELESEWQYGLSEEQLSGPNTKEEGKSDSALESEHVQAFTAAYPYSMLVSHGACVWEWPNDYEQLVSLHRCCVD